MTIRRHVSKKAFQPTFSGPITITRYATAGRCIVLDILKLQKGSKETRAREQGEQRARHFVKRGNTQT